MRRIYSLKYLENLFITYPSNKIILNQIIIICIVDDNDIDIHCFNNW